MLSMLNSVANSETYALVVGINEYQQAQDNAGTRSNLSLTGCENDAHAIQSLLTSVFKVQSSNVQLLLSANVTGNELIKQLIELAKKAKPGDTVLFHYSGHGIQIPSKCEEDGFDEALLMSDLSVVLDDDLGEYQRALAARGIHVRFTIDSCYSGGMGRPVTRLSLDGRQVDVGARSVPARDLPDGKPRYVAPLANLVQKWAHEVKVSNVQGSSVIIFASQESQRALEVRTGTNPRGFFTWFLVDSIRKSPSQSLAKLFDEIKLRFWKKSLDDRQLPALFCPNKTLLDKPLFASAPSILAADFLTFSSGPSSEVTVGLPQSKCQVETSR